MTAKGQNKYPLLDICYPAQSADAQPEKCTAPMPASLHQLQLTPMEVPLSWHVVDQMYQPLLHCEGVAAAGGTHQLPCNPCLEILRPADVHLESCLQWSYKKHHATAPSISSMPCHALKEDGHEHEHDGIGRHPRCSQSWPILGKKSEWMCIPNRQWVLRGFHIMSYPISAALTYVSSSQHSSKCQFIPGDVLSCICDLPQAVVLQHINPLSHILSFTLSIDGSSLLIDPWLIAHCTCAVG